MSDQSNDRELSELSDEQLQALAESYRETGSTLSGQAVGEGDAEATAAIVAAAEAYQGVIDELAARESARGEEMERARRAAEILQGPIPGVAVDGDAAGGDSVPVEETAEPVAASTETTTFAAIVPPDPAEPAPAASTQETTVPDETALDLTAIPDPVGQMAAIVDGAAVGVASTEGRLWAQPNKLRMGSRTRQPGSLIKFMDTGMVNGASKGETLEPGELAERIATKYDSVKRMGVAPGAAPITMATAIAPIERRLGGDPILNAHMLQEAARDFQRDVALVAAGGNCAIPTNNYEVFNAAEEQAPVEGFLRSMGAERGGMRYLAAPDWVASQAGVAVTTDAQDAAGYTNQDPAGPTPPKVCYQAECPEELECVVDAVSACAGFGNLTYRTAPELVQVLLDQLAVAHAQAKEITFLDAIEAGSTAISPVADSYGAFRSAVLALDNTLWAYRKRNHIGRNTPIDVLAPDTMIPLFKADFVADLHLGANFYDVDQETLAAQLFESLGANVEFYYDYTTGVDGTGAASAQQNAQVAGLAHNLPSDFRVFAYAPGTWIRLDGGVLNVGLVRDSILNSQNNLQLFSEEWTQACKVGFESIAVDLTLCPSGVGPEPTSDVRTCAS